jgi:hypothetical protein
VRWRRPGRGMLLRLAAVAVLLATAAAVSWSPPQPCAPSAGARRTGGHTTVAAARVSAAASGAVAATPPDRSAAAAAPDGSRVMPAGSVGVPVRLADPTALGLVRPGNRVDLLRLGAGGGATTVAVAALVLDVTGASDPTAGGLLLALTPTEARQAVTTPERGFAIVIRPG